MEIYDVMDDKTKKQNRKPDFKQIMISDATLESIHYIHKINRRGLGYHKDELVGFFNDMNKYRKGSDEQFWLESFNNNDYIINRVTKEPLMVENAMINVIGGIQPSILNSIAGAANGNGILERFLYTSAESNIYPINGNDINIEWINWYNQTIQNFNNFFSYIDHESSQILEMTPEAFAKFVEVDTWICLLQKSDDETKGLTDYLNKMKTYMPRLALLILLIDYLFEGGNMIVDLKHMNKAHELCKYFIDSARKIFLNGERNEEILDVKKSLKLKGYTKAEQIIELHKKGLKQVEIAKLMKTTASYVSKVIQEVIQEKIITK
jgi:hypothetical protein